MSTVNTTETIKPILKDQYPKIKKLIKKLKK